MDGARLSNLFLDQESSDIQVHLHTSCEDQEAVVPAHSLVLRTAGKAFKTMLDTHTSKENQTPRVELMIKGDLHDAIRFLRYLYTRELADADLSAYISLLQTALQYEMDDLAKLCEAKIREKVNPLNVCRTYRHIRNLASEYLLVYFRSLMLDFAFLIFWKKLHLNLDKKTVAFLFTSNELNVLDSEQSREALWRWQCTRQAFEIPIESKTQEIIANVLSLKETWFFENAFDLDWLEDYATYQTSALLNEYVHNAEQLDLRKYWSSGKEESIADKLSRAYFIKTSPRLQNKITKFAKVCCLIKAKNCSNDFKVTGNIIHLMNITVNVDIFLAGFTVQVHCKTPSDKKIQEILSFHLNSKILLVDNYKIKINVSVEKLIAVDLKISLRTPVLLQKAKNNVLTMEIKPSPLFTSFLGVYTFHKDSMLYSDDAGVFSNQDKNVGVNKLNYLV